MKPDILSDVKVVIAEPKASLRKRLADDVRALGCRKIIETGNLRDVQDAFYDGEIDVLIGESELPEGSISEFVHDVRHGVAGDDPFIIAIVLISEPDPELVKRAVNCGVDDIIMKPVKPDDLRQRLRVLSRVRKPFVVTTDYIGPDRRSKKRKAGLQIPLIKAPNPLHLRGSGRHSEFNMKKAINRGIKQVNEQKVERHAYSIHWLMDRIIAVNNGEMTIEELDMGEQFERLNMIAGDIAGRLSGTSYDHAADICLTLEKMTSVIKVSPDMATDGEIELLGKLATVIKRKCNGNDPIAEEAEMQKLAAKTAVEAEAEFKGTTEAA